MCYSMISCVGQSAQVPAANPQGDVPMVDSTSYTSYGSSPAGGSSSGYASAGHVSPSSEFDSFENMLDQVGDLGVKLEEPQLQLLSEVSPARAAAQFPWPSHGQPPPPHYGYPHQQPGYQSAGTPLAKEMAVDPMCGAAPYGYPPKYFGSGVPPYPYGAIAGSNFSFSNYPQTTENTTSPLGLSPPPGSSQTLCRVCGDTASGNHFGVLSCEACKSFFRRSIRANARYACRGSRTCAIEKHTRNRCQYCRLQKCAESGMRKEAVQEERTPQGAKLQRATTPQPLGFSSTLNLMPPSIPYFPPSFDTPTSPIPRVLSQASRMYGSLPNLKMEFDRQTASSPMTSSGPGMIPGRHFMETGNSQLSVSVLVNADMQSEGPLEEILMSNTSLKLEDLFEGFRSSLLKVIEWAKRIPAFVNLSLDDQVKLLKASWCEHCTLKLASRNGPKSDTILLSHGLSVKREAVEDPEVRRVLHRVFNEVAYWLDYLNVDRVEIACLRGIMLFNPDAKGLSPASRKKVEIYQEQILQSLETRTKSIYPVSPQRFSKLLLRLAPLKAIALEVMQHMEVQRALGNTKMDNLFGELLDFE
jgi:hypothetical protein